MRVAGSLERFVGAPLGRWISGPTFIVWNWSAKLGGMTAWGSPSEADVQRMFILLDAYHRAAPSCDVVTDMSRVESIGEASFAAFFTSMRARVDKFYGAARRHAVIRPTGAVGAMTEGFFRVVGARHSWRAFDDVKAAFDWVAPPHGPRAWAELEGLIDQAMAVTPEMRQLREFLRARLQTATLAEAARAQGQSQRTLQRMLADAGTGFRAELAALRVEAARRLLAEADIKIDDIARRVGFSSHAHLTTHFRRVTGQSPSQFRALARSRKRMAGG